MEKCGKIIYVLEVGVNANGEDNVENEICDISLDFLKEYGLNYVINGVEGTYYVIYKGTLNNTGDYYHTYDQIVDTLRKDDIHD